MYLLLALKMAMLVTGERITADSNAKLEQVYMHFFLTGRERG